ncbi:hypothetical protein ABK040_010729 [Willaertia magna]
MNPKLASSILLIAPKKLLNRKQQILTKSSCFDYSLLLLERNENISSFAKMFVFPGGSVDEKVDNHWGIENQIKTGAIRELFEEGKFRRRKGLSIMSDPTPFNTPFTQPTMIFNKEGKIKGIEDEILTPKTIKIVFPINIYMKKLISLR